MAVNDVDVNARITAMKALHALGDPRGVDGLLAAAKDPNLRRRALYRLGDLDDPRAREALAVAVTDEDPDIRYAACWGLLRQCDRRGALPFIAFLKMKEFYDEGDTVLKQFVALHEPAVVEPLLDLAREGTLSNRVFALRALGGLRAKAAFPVLRTALMDEFTLIREAAAKGLGDAGDREAVAPLIAALADPSSKVREAAAASLGQLKARKAGKALQALLTSEESPRVRDAVDKALHEITR
jgi:HEAT repeat protein